MIFFLNKYDKPINSGFKFFNYPQDAKNAGYFPITHWSNLKREIIPGEKPSAYVPYGEVEKGIGLNSTNDVYLTQEGKYFYVSKYYEYFSQEQTVPKGTSPSVPNSPNYLNFLSSSLPLSSPICLKSEEIIGKMKENEEYFQCYLPEGFSEENVPVELLDDLPRLCYLINLIYSRRIQSDKKHDKDYFQPLMWEYLNNMGIYPILRKALQCGFIERDYYIKGEKAYGYRLVNPELRNKTFRLNFVRNKTMAEKIIFQKHDYSRTEVGHHIYDMLQQITVDMESAQRELEGTDDDIHLHALQIIEMGLFFATDDDFGGRFYSNMTGLLSGSKKYLRVDGQPLHHIDIKNSQPLFLGLVMKQEGIPGIEEYLEAVINGKLYELISDKAGYTLSYGAEAGRKIVKDHIRQKILFAKESASDVLLTKFVFKELFPAVIEYIAASKQGVQQHSKKKKKDVGVDLAHKLQTMEREFIIDRCCTRIMKERPDMWFTTIHDCILYKPEDAPYVVGVVKEEFAKLGISPIVEDKPVN